LDGGAFGIEEVEGETDAVGESEGESEGGEGSGGLGAGVTGEVEWASGVEVGGGEAESIREDGGEFRFEAGGAGDDDLGDRRVGLGS